MRQRLARAFMLAGLPEPMMAVETDSLSLKLPTLRMTDCLGLTTTQILTQEEAQGVVAARSRGAAVSTRGRHHQPPACRLSPSVKLVIAELRKIAAKYGPN